MKVYKDAHRKIFSPYIISKNVLEKEFTTSIPYFPGSVKKVLNVLWHAKNNSVQNQGHKQHVIVNMLFQKVIFGNLMNKVINGNIVNMMLKIIEHPHITRLLLHWQEKHLGDGMFSTPDFGSRSSVFECDALLHSLLLSPSHSLDVTWK